MYISNRSDWKEVQADNFWGEIAPCEHVVQIYEKDDIFVDTLAGFVSSGIKAGDCVIVIATNTHLAALSDRLSRIGIDLDAVIAGDRFVPLDAETVLSTFVVNGWPNEALFMKTVSRLTERATKRNRRLRAFGEMVAVLWAQGRYGATVNLEHLWNKFCNTQVLSLFCAYPRSGFTNDINQSITGICKCHSKVIDGSKATFNEIRYRDVI